MISDPTACNKLRILSRVALREYDRTGKTDELASEGVAWMVRCEGARTTLTGPKYLADFDASERLRESANFTLDDLRGKTWTLEFSSD